MSNPVAINTGAAANVRDRGPVPGSPHYASQAGLENSTAAVPPRLQAVALPRATAKVRSKSPSCGASTSTCSPASSCRSSAHSGSGKSTLLHLLGLLDGPDAGQVCFDGARIDNLPARRRDALRNRQFGMIFQFYHLLPELSTLENVLAPQMIAAGTLSYLRNRRRLAQEAKDLLNVVGLGHRLRHRPRELSGGEMQRAAIARALSCGRRSSWPTSRRAISTGPRAGKSCAFCEP